jgi:phosphohistidine phosphatase
MKLYIVRHAEAEERGPGMKDFDRALTLRGVKQAKALGRALERAEEPMTQRPELVLSSPAVRAVQTATLIAAALKMQISIDARIGLEAGVSDAAELVRSLVDREATCVLVVGHNPTLEDLAAMLGAGTGLKKAELVAVKVEAKGKVLVGKNACRTRPED